MPRTFYLHVCCALSALVQLCCSTPQLFSQTGEAGELYLERLTEEARGRTELQLGKVDLESWPERKAAWRLELQEMLGLLPWPEKTPLRSEVTGEVELEDVRVKRLHYQSRPGLYVTANLYEPLGDAPEAGWPAVLYVCGHAQAQDQGRLLGNKTGYQHHGLWLAKHGVACLMIDTTQLGELHGAHHGTYRLGRWDWITRGYTPAGVEAWNAIRGIDLLCSMANIDASNIGLTGRSGGGAYSWFTAALDDRIKVVVPVAGITDLQNHIVDGCVEGHCDCMFFVNYFGWDYAKLAALVAPRPLLLANSDTDTIFPLDGVMRVHRQLSSLYGRLGASDRYGLLVTPGPHQDTQELQVGAFKWLLKHLKGESPVIESAALKEIDPRELVVFEREIPRDERVSSLSSWFVPAAASVGDPEKAAELWKTVWHPAIQRMTWYPHQAAMRLPSAEFAGQSSGSVGQWKWSAMGRLPLSGETLASSGAQLLRLSGSELPVGKIIHLCPELPQTLNQSTVAELLKTDERIAELLMEHPSQEHYFVRGRGASYLEAVASPREKTMRARRLYLLGRTPETLDLEDLVEVIRWVATEADSSKPVSLTGHGRTSPLVALATLIAVENSRAMGSSLPIDSLYLRSFPTNPLLAPVLPGLLRICDFSSLQAAATACVNVVFEPAESSGQSAELLVDTASAPEQASGLRIVEVDQDSAKIWVRATRYLRPNLGSLPKVEFEEPAKRGSKQNQKPILPEMGVDGLQYAVPGVKAEMRVGYRAASDSKWNYTEWQAVDETTDYSMLISLEGLTAGENYRIRSEARGINETKFSTTLSGSFSTLPATDQSAVFKLAVGTCQDFNDRDGPHGFDVYRTILDRKTDAFVLAGDVVYYDALARSVPLAYYHWQRTYSLPTLVNFHKQVPSYFLKDDHDTYVNDTWPGTRFKWTGDFTFEDGQRIFKQETGLPAPGYRTFQIGKDLQVWMMEGRDYRSPNNIPDGPEKTIWGAEQWKWLQETMEASTAKFRVVISPTPIVGPDRKNKSDNHSNTVFETEGRKVRKFLASYPNTVSVCGDRHWQFHSVDPETGLNEFSVGPVSDRHAGGWNQNDFRPEIHRFLKVAGGYLEIELWAVEGAPRLSLRHLDTQGNERHSHTLE